MSEIIKIALLGIAGVLFAIQFRQQRPEYTLLIGFALSVLVFSYVLGLTGQLLEEFAGLQHSELYMSYILHNILLRVLEGIILLPFESLKGLYLDLLSK